MNRRTSASLQSSQRPHRPQLMRAAQEQNALSVNLRANMLRDHTSSNVSTSLTKAIAILETLAGRPGSEYELGLTEISRRSGLAKTSVHRLLTTLQLHRFVQQSPRTGKYSLGLKLYELGSTAINRLELRQAAVPAMNRLAADTGERAYLTIPWDNDVLCLEVIQGAELADRLYTPRGARLPFHAGAVARILLAFMPESEIQRIVTSRPLVSYTRKTITDPATLLDLLRREREQGYAVSVEEVSEGAWAVAAPLRDRSSIVVGALGLVGPTHRLDEDRLRKISVAVRHTASAISYQLGHHELLA